jgi:hypothetical protein
LIDVSLHQLQLIDVQRYQPLLTTYTTIEF